MRHSYVGEAHRRFNGGGGGSLVLLIIAGLIWLIVKACGG